MPTSATFDAFDVTKDLFPRQEWLPSNVKFHHLDIFKPVLEEFVGKYDMVHIRFFWPVVGKTGPVPATETTLQLLKPGGFLQWDEREISFKVAENGASKTKAMEALRDELNGVLKKMANDVRWITKLDKVPKPPGLVDVQMEQHPIPKTMRVYQMDLGFQTIEEATFGINRIISNSFGDAVRAKLATAYEEHRLHGSSVELT